MAKLELTDITSGYNVATAYNDNNDAIEVAIENTLSRDGTAPNDMQADLDMGGFRIINLAEPTSDNDAVRLIDVANIVAGGDIIISPTTAWDNVTNVPALVDDIGSLTDPGADRILFWDDSAGTVSFLQAGTGITISGTTISASVASVDWSGITNMPDMVDSLGDLTDPNADRILFWDDSAGELAHLTVSTGLVLSGTSLALSHLGLQSLVDPNADRILFWDDSVGSLQWLSVGSGISITGSSIGLDGSLADFGALTDPGADRLIFWDDSAGAHVYLSVGDNLLITGDEIAFNSSVGTFTGTLTGVTSGSGTVRYARNGDMVTLSFPTITGTSNSTAHTITGLPVELHPANEQNCVGVTVDNNTAAFGKVTVGTNGTITLHNGLSATFSGTGDEGIDECNITYILN